MIRPTYRRGYTLFELIVVMAILLLLAAIILPSIGAFRGDTRQRAAADVVRGELAIARARAKAENQPYRIAISQDGTRLRRAPDSTNFAQANADSSSSSSASAIDYPFDHITAAVVTEGNNPPPVANDGWVTLATVQPDGTCLDDGTVVSLTDADGAAMYLHIRGLTASSRVIPNPKTANKNGGKP